MCVCMCVCATPPLLACIHPSWERWSLVKIQRPSTFYGANYKFTVSNHYWVKSKSARVRKTWALSLCRLILCVDALIVKWK